MTRDEFGQQFTTCWICGWKGSVVNPLTTHEIARGASRQAALKEPAAWVRACMTCHQGELDAMPIARQIAYQALGNPEHYDRAKVNLLRRRAPDAISEKEVICEIADIVRKRQSGTM